MERREGGEAKKRRRSVYEKDDEYQIEDDIPASRRKSKRRIKEKKIYDPGSPNGTSLSPSPVPMIPLAPIPLVSAEQIEDEDMRDCFELLNKVMDIPTADPFLEPVDYVTLKLWLYPTIVTKPMDLGTVKKMLEHDVLENPGHFADHIRLVFQNAMEFNTPGSEIYNDAENLLATFDAEFKKLCDKWDSDRQMEERIYKTERQPENPIKEEEKKADIDSEEKEKQEIESMQQTLNALKASNLALRKQIDNLKKNKKKQSKIKRIRLSTPKAPLTYKEKEELCKLITILEPDDLPGLLEIIQSANPSYGGGDDGEFEIDIEGIDDMTLLDVKKYVEKSHAEHTPTYTKPARRSGGRAGGGTRNRQRAPPAELPQLDHDTLAIAEIQTTQRMNKLERQIQDIKSQQI